MPAAFDFYLASVEELDACGSGGGDERPCESLPSRVLRRMLNEATARKHRGHKDIDELGRILCIAMRSQQASDIMLWSNGKELRI